MSTSPKPRKGTVKKTPAKRAKAKPAPKPQPRVATPAEVLAEVAELTRLRPLIPSHSLFGDCNTDKVDAEIRVLEEGMDESDIMEAFFPHSASDFPDAGDPEETAREMNSEEGRSYDVESSARSAMDWRDGHSTDKPSDGWAPLVKGS